jgi:hypothetical protein
LKKKKIEEAKLKINKLGVKFNFFFQKKKKKLGKNFGAWGGQGPPGPYVGQLIIEASLIFRK